MGLTLQMGVLFLVWRKVPRYTKASTAQVWENPNFDFQTPSQSRQNEEAIYNLPTQSEVRGPSARESVTNPESQDPPQTYCFRAWI